MAVFSVDVGGTGIKLGLVNEGQLLARDWLDARSDEGLASALPRITTSLRAMSSEKVTGVAMAFPSLIDGNRVVGDVGKFLDAEQIDLEAWAHSEFGVPFAIDNDARMSAIGEWLFGAAKGFSDVVVVTLGTGIGTGVIQDSKPMRGKHGAAGILGGHMTAQVGGEQCPCGNVGCWETLASTAALRRAGHADYAQVFAADDPESRQLRERSLEVWGALAVSLIHAYDPEVLVFGGGVMGSGDMILSSISETVNLHAWTPWGAPKIFASTAGADAALLAGEWILEANK